VAVDGDSRDIAPDPAERILGVEDLRYFIEVLGSKAFDQDDQCDEGIAGFVDCDALALYHWDISWSVVGRAWTAGDAAGTCAGSAMAAWLTRALWQRGHGVMGGVARRWRAGVGSMWFEQRLIPAE
jgi:hypothetical protein